MKSLLNKTKGLVAAGTLALLMGGVGQAEAVMINFDSIVVAPGTTVALTNQFTGLGVTFSNAQIFNFNDVLPGGPVIGTATLPNGLSAPGPVAPGSPAFNPFPLSPIVATFSSAIDFVSILATDVALDGASLVAYDAVIGGNVVGSQTIVSPVEIAQTLSVAGSGIFRIEMFQTFEDGQLPFGDGMAWDNLTFNVEATNPNPNPIPEPNTMVLLGSGLAGIFGWQLRKQKKQA